MTLALRCDGRACLTTGRSLLLLVLLVLVSPTWGYRPFVSTDAAVADPHEMELELGYWGLRRAGRRQTLITPQVVVNYGVVRDWEVVGEFTVEEPPHASARLVDPGLFLKAVLKEGILQHVDGRSCAIEIGPLFPSTAPEEKQFGFEGLGILSGALFPLTYHLNVGGGIAQDKATPFALWGIILELPVLSRLRLVGEVNGESRTGAPAENSGLVGLIWQPSSPHVLLDVGWRKGMSRQAAWQWTMGFTWSLTFPVGPHASLHGGTP